MPGQKLETWSNLLLALRASSSPRISTNALRGLTFNSGMSARFGSPPMIERTRSFTCFQVTVSGNCNWVGTVSHTTVYGRVIARLTPQRMITYTLISLCRRGMVNLGGSVPISLKSSSMGILNVETQQSTVRLGTDVESPQNRAVFLGAVGYSCRRLDRRGRPRREHQSVATPWYRPLKLQSGQYSGKIVGVIRP